MKKKNKKVFKVSGVIAMWRFNQDKLCLSRNFNAEGTLEEISENFIDFLKEGKGGLKRLSSTTS